MILQPHTHTMGIATAFRNKMKNQMKNMRVFTTKILSNTKLREILWVALLYGLTARISQCFAIAPGNISPIWISSGIMLAIALYRGVNIWPGIFIGAFIGNIWAYLSFDSVYSIINAINAASLNGLGDTLGITGAAYILKHKIKNKRLISSLPNLFWFIAIAVILGPLISAFFGVEGLVLFGFLENTQFLTTFFTRLIGDSTGILIFTPVILAWAHPLGETTRCSISVSIGCIIYALAISSLSFGLVNINQYVFYTLLMALPALFYLLFNYSQKFTFSIQISVVAVAIFATALEKGPFAGVGSSNASLIKLQLFTSIFSLVIYVLAIFSLEKAQIKASLEKRKNELEKLYRLDALTQLWNRYRIQENLEIELNRYRRERRPFGIIMIDIDDFKRINDQFRHLGGDKVLVEISSLIKNQIRESDLLGRWGGEEFIIIVSDTSIASLTILAEKIRKSVSDYTFCINKQVTVSIGISLSCDTDNEFTLIDRADEALYKAKQDNKNCVRSVEPRLLPILNPTEAPTA